MRRLSKKLMTGLLSLISLLTFSATSIGVNGSAHARSNQKAMMTHQRKRTNKKKKKRSHNKKRGHGNAKKPTVITHQGLRNTTKQVQGQKRPQLAKHVRKQANRKATKNDWFKDGLNKKELGARNWISAHESGHRWNVLSYGGRCIGYFQLDPAYLGKKNGHVNLNHQHQVKVADAYAKSRYGSWQNAKRFWQAHHWY